MSICLGLADADWALTKDVFSVVGTIISGAAVGVAFYFGRQGLTTWQRQMKGTSDHQLARRALIELYRYREGMERARSPIMFQNELDLTEDEKKNRTFAEIRHLGKRKGYQDRFEVLYRARGEIHVTLLEAEAVWGREIKGMFTPLFKLQQEFYIYMDNHLMAIDPREDADTRRVYREVLEGRRNILFDKLDDTGDSFRQEFNDACSVIENYLKSKL